MDTEFRATLLLANAAEVADGKLFILGGGWSVYGPTPTPSAVAIKIDVPWSQANRIHQWVLRLEGEDDAEVVQLPTPEGLQPVEIGGEFELGRPPGVKEGTPLDLPLAIGLGPMPLDAGRRYQWRLLINHQSRPEWVLSFTVRSV